MHNKNKYNNNFTLSEEILQDLSLIEDEFFIYAVDRNPELADFLIKPVMDYFNIKDYQIISVKADVNFSNLNQHGARIDCVVKLDNNRDILIEVQNTHPERMPLKRIQFENNLYQSKQLKKGQDYSELPDTIFIVYSKEPLKELNNGKPVSDLATCDRLDNFKIIQDFGRIIVVNGKYKLEGFEAFTDVIEELQKSDLDEIRNPVIKDIHQKVKYSEEGRNMYKEFIKEHYGDLIEENEELQKQHLKDQEQLLKNQNEIRTRDEQLLKNQNEIRTRDEQLLKSQDEINSLKELLKSNNIPIPSV